jgi:integrase
MTAMKWWGWGHEHVSFTHEDKPELAPFIRKNLGVDIERPTARPTAFEDVEVAEPNLPDDLRAELEAAVGDVSTEPLDRVVHARGKCLRDLVRHRSGEVGRVPDAVVRPASEPEVEALLGAVVGDDPTARRDRAILEVLYGTGLRISELVGLRLGDVDLESALLRAFGKGAKERVVPVGRPAVAALGSWLGPGGRSALVPERWARRSDADAVFLNRRGGRLTRQGAWLVVKRWGAEVGLEARLTPHVLRHSCATHMLDHGADLRSVQELLGHASVSTTQVYTKVSAERLVAAYRAAHPRARIAAP